jgi:hypothetical protein
MIDDKIEDGDIGPLWTEHYPKRADRIMSKALCLMLFYVIADRAHSIYPHGDWSDTATLAPILWCTKSKIH